MLVFKRNVTEKMYSIKNTAQTVSLNRSKCLEIRFLKLVKVLRRFTEDGFAQISVPTLYICMYVTSRNNKSVSV